MVLEYVKTKLTKGTAKEKFIELAKIVDRDFLTKQPGFIEHRSWWTPDGLWVDTVLWSSLQEAEAADAAAMKSELCGSWFSMMDENVMENAHYSEATQY